jgi:hypothetical protein
LDEDTAAPEPTDVVLSLGDSPLLIFLPFISSDDLERVLLATPFVLDAESLSLGPAEAGLAEPPRLGG